MSKPVINIHVYRLSKPVQSFLKTNFLTRQSKKSVDFESELQDDYIVPLCWYRSTFPPYTRTSLKIMSVVHTTFPYRMK